MYEVNPLTNKEVMTNVKVNGRDDGRTHGWTVQKLYASMQGHKITGSKFR